MKGRGYYYPTVEFVEPFSSWLTTYATSWGDWLSSSESWNSFNDFFSRKLSSPAVRPIADATVVAPADSWPKELWEIGEDNRLVYPADLQIKTAKLSDIGRFWRWHINFCPGFKGYFTHQDEETKAALREKYNFKKYQ